MSKIQITDLTAKEVADALKLTSLELVFIANPPKGYPFLAAAHSDTRSFVVLRQTDGSFEGWRYDGGTKAQRTRRYHASLKRIVADGMGEVCDPSGKPAPLRAKAGTSASPAPCEN